MRYKKANVYARESYFKPPDKTETRQLDKTPKETKRRKTIYSL